MFIYGKNIYEKSLFKKELMALSFLSGKFSIEFSGIILFVSKSVRLSFGKLALVINTFSVSICEFKVIGR